MDTGGTGTLEMIRVCREAGLPEPSQQRGDQWTVTLWARLADRGLLECVVAERAAAQRR
jgi:hypothetical protein